VAGRAAAPTRRRRVLFVQSVPHAHHPRHHYRLAAALAEAGYDVTTLAPPDLSPGQVDAVPVEYLPPRRGRLARMTSAPLTVRAAARRRPMVVHVVSLDLLPWAVLLRLLRRRVVLYDSNEDYASMMLIKEWVPPWSRRLLGRLVGWAEPWLAARLDAATTALPATHEKFTRAGVRSVLVRNFPPLSLIQDGSPPGEHQYDVLLGGSLPDDQVPLLAATAAELERLRPGVRWLLAARSYGEREQQMLESALEKAGVRKRFELHYNVPFAEMKAMMAASAIGFVLYPADVNYAARIPIRIFEYMASGLPFVASDLSTTAEFTRGWGVADLVPAGDPVAYARALAALLDDPERQAAMRARGPVLAREEYNWQRESAKLVDLYRSLVGPP
jgi:glycosyltransferase involved in cell wall biosynthesis